MEKTLIYEMWPVQVNNLAEKGKQLEQIKELGATHVWLRTNKRTTLEPYKNIADAINVEKLYGNKEEFASFIKEVHEYDLKVIIDLDVNIPAENEEDYDDQIRAIRNIATVWFLGYGVDGFYLNAEDLCLPLALNVLNDLFTEPFGPDKVRPFLVVGCNDSSYSYAFGILKDAPVDLIDDCYLRTQVERKDLKGLVCSISRDRDISKDSDAPKAAVSLETYGSQRIGDLLGESSSKVAEALFMNGPDSIILYQGQELGEKNVNMNWINDYNNQSKDKNSPLTWYLFYIGLWKNN